jgi:hypothetical protein
MRNLLITSCIFACLPIYAGIEVSFPTTNEAKEPLELKVVQASAQTNDPPEPIRIDGLVVYYSGVYHPQNKTHQSKLFDELKEGMTLNEIVSLLGPGSQNKFEGVGFVYWHCEDGRVLKVLPTRQINEKANFYIALHGSNQRHEDVALLAKSLVSTLNITEQKIEVILKQDTNQAKAGQVRTYEVGQTFQKVEPLPRIDFHITKIEGNSVHCRYFYQAQPKGLLRYTEDGDLIMHNREQDGGGQPATRPESK